MKRDPVPFQAVAPGPFTLMVLLAPLSAPDVRVTSPVKVWVDAVPASRVSVPPEPLIVSPAPFTFPERVAVPPVLIIETGPVVEKPAMLCVPDPPILMADPLAVKVPLLTKFPPKVKA